MMTRLCASCADEYAAWLHYRPRYQAQFTLTDKASDMSAINHERWRDTVNAQHRLIINHCEEMHRAESA